MKEAELNKEQLGKDISNWKDKIEERKHEIKRLKEERQTLIDQNSG